MEWYILSAFIASLACFAIGGFVYFTNKKGRVNKFFALGNISLGIWNLGDFFVKLSTSNSAALFWDKFSYVGAILMVPFFVNIIFSLTDIKEIKEVNRISLVLYSIATLLVLVTFCTPFVIRGVTISPFKELLGFLYPIFILFFLGGLLYGLYYLHRAYIKSSGGKRNQLKYMFLGISVGAIAAAIFFLTQITDKILPIHYIIEIGYVSIIAYAILRYRLMEINIALTRAGIFVVVYTLVLGIPFWIGFKFLGQGLWIIPVSVTAFLATLGPFIYLYVDRKAEERLLKEQKRYQESLKQASIGMTRIRDLKRLLDLITHIVTKTVRISFAAIYLHSAETNEYVLQVSRDKGRVPIPKLASDNPLITWITAKRDPLIYEEIKRLMEDINDTVYRNLEENMRLLTASVIIPSFLEDKFIGFFVLGEKLSGQIYTLEDLNVFQILASQAALAIENAQFYEEAKEMQEQIAQAEKMATVGTMADGLSHQINNRFYALSLIAGDTIDTIKLTDTSKCTPEVKEMIGQINHALERIQVNVMQGGEVVRGILKYTRKGDEGFEALTLDQVIDGTLDMVQYKIKLSEIDIVRNYPKDTPKIKGNLVQLQEAFFNFIDNAYDSIVERRDILKEEGYRGKITVSAQPQPDGKLEIVVQDNGMGMKDSSRKRVFTPFFTTKASSHKGTGLGLYVIKRIIEENNQGKISFASEYGQGTSFFVELPLA